MLGNIYNRAIPSFVVSDNPKFALFVERFFDYLDREEGEHDLVSNLLAYLDIDTTLDDYDTYYLATYGEGIPPTISSDIKVLIKNLRQLYQSKGVEDSYKFLFKSLYNVDIEFYYPKVDMLRVSDGRWVEPYYLFPDGISRDSTDPVDIAYMNQYVGKTLKGRTSGAEGWVYEYTNATHSSSAVTMVLSLQNVTNGPFVAGEDCEVIEGGVADYTIHSVDGVSIENGQWTSTDGFLDSDKLIQDSYKYQDFCYVIRSEISAATFKNIVKNILHPAGMRFEGELLATPDVISLYPTGMDTLRDNVELTVVEVSLPAYSSYSFSGAGLGTIGATRVWQYTYAGFEAARETDFIDKTWVMQDLDNVVIGDFESKASERMYLNMDTIQIEV